MHQALSILVILLINNVQVQKCALLGGAFRTCRRGDPDLERCVVDSLNGARGALRAGIPELGLPPLAPLAGDEVRIEEGPGDLHLQVVFRNFTWSGLTDFVATRSRVDFARSYMEIETIIGDQNVTGKYTFSGGILTLRISGQGDYHLSFKGNVTHRFDLKEIKRDGETFWMVDKYKWDMTLTAFRCNFENLFRGNKRLGIYANDFINRNWKPASLIYREVINESLGKFIKSDIVDKFFEKVPLRKFMIE